MFDPFSVTTLLNLLICLTCYLLVYSARLLTQAPPPAFGRRITLPLRLPRGGPRGETPAWRFVLRSTGETGSAGDPVRLALGRWTPCGNLDIGRQLFKSNFSRGEGSEHDML